VRSAELPSSLVTQPMRWPTHRWLSAVGEDAAASSTPRCCRGLPTSYLSQTLDPCPSPHL
jgi:hypothetical protein